MKVTVCITDVYSAPWRVKERPFGLSFVATNGKLVNALLVQIIWKTESADDWNGRDVGGLLGCSGGLGLTGDMGILRVKCARLSDRYHDDHTIRVLALPVRLCQTCSRSRRALHEVRMDCKVRPGTSYLGGYEPDRQLPHRPEALNPHRDRI